MYHYENSPVGLLICIDCDVDADNCAYLERAIALASADGKHVMVSFESCRRVDPAGVAVLSRARSRFTDRLHLLATKGSAVHEEFKRASLDDVTLAVSSPRPSAEPFAFAAR